jgi:hypothetical protein
MPKPTRRRTPRQTARPAPQPPQPPQPLFVAFASLPFGLQGGAYPVWTYAGVKTVHVSELRYNPFLSIYSRPELLQSIPPSGQGDGLTTYTWYDHPFVLRVVFGRNVAALGAINSSATVAEPLPQGLTLQDPDLGALLETFANEALVAFNSIIAVVRRQARLYHVFDLRRDDIDLSIRTVEGVVLREDPLQAQLIHDEEAQAEAFDLSGRDESWYEELAAAFREPEAVSLADDLLIEAERALKQRFPRQAIATSTSTIEAAASALLTRGMQRRDLTDEEIDEALSGRSLTAKLDVLMRRYTGFSLKTDQLALWRSFNELNNLRNDIVHRGMRPTDEQATFAIAVARDILRWLHMVSQRNR